MDISDGTSQNDRKSFLVQDDFLNIDELSFHDLLCYTIDLAKKVKYFNLQNQQEGNWDELLLTDEIVVISEIIVLDTRAMEKEFIDTIKDNFDTYDDYFSRQVDIIFKLVECVDSWHQRLNSIDAFYSDGLIKVLDELIRTKLAGELLVCKIILQKLNARNWYSGKLEKYNHLSNIWGNHSNPHIDSLNINSENQISDQFNKTFYTFHNTINYIKQIAGVYLDKSFKNQLHSPYLSLFFTFLKLFINVRNRLNPFPQKYFKYLYDDILKIRPKGYLPDSTYLLLSLKDGFDNFFIPKGTRFLAGKDETKKDIYYSADNDTVINKAKIGQIRTFYQEKNELIWPKIDCTSLLVDEIPCLAIENFKPGNTDMWPLFGGTTSPTRKNADLGFVVSDTNLLLQEGNREIRVSICFTEESFVEFAVRLEKAKGEYLLNEILIKLFSNIFSIYVTTEEGWFKIDNYLFDSYLINGSLEPYSINIQFSLLVDDPSVTAYNPEVHGYDFARGLPAAKFLINNESYLFPYSLIDDLELERITTSVRVSNLKNTLIFNELGKIDTTKPFYPFGVIPKLNSSFILGNYEISRKKINGLDVQIKWNSLPEDENGLQAYFSGYDETISKSDYKCKISFLNDGNWLPEDKSVQEQVNLFASNPPHDESPKEKLHPVTLLNNISTFYYQVDKRRIEATDFGYNKNTLGGFVKISLCNPPFLFGHNKYPECLTKVTLANAKKKVPKPLPNPPFSPVIEDLTINYTSISQIEFSAKQTLEMKTTRKFYHLHPWGYEEIQKYSNNDKIRLVPVYNHQGNLLIGLMDATPNMTISILFNLLDDSILEEDNELPEITWEYLASNQWKPLPKLNLISDSTNTFLESGIVIIRMPQDIDKQNTILGNNYHWLKVSAKGNLESVCSVVNISTQAIKVTWENKDNSLSHLDAPLPLTTIAKPEITLPGIKTILQVVNSFGGNPPENIQQAKIRVGEQLIHKNRAVTPWDYERLILDAFPDIYKVKCLPHMSSGKLKDPGNVLIAVIGKVDKNNLRIDYEPMVNQSTLHKIKSFVSQMASGFANIEVRNPVFERVLVRCAVKFNEGLDAGYFIERLNNEIIDYITPWQTTGNNEPGFGKVIKCSDVLSFIQSLSFVEYATDFSMIQISRDTRFKYHLHDTARKKYVEYSLEQIDDNELAIERKILKPSDPWGILISAERHAIEVINKMEETEPYKTGIDELEVGETFIIK
jgi:hypothetical protein